MHCSLWELSVVAEKMLNKHAPSNFIYLGPIPPLQKCVKLVNDSAVRFFKMC